MEIGGIGSQDDQRREKVETNSTTSREANSKSKSSIVITHLVKMLICVSPNPSVFDLLVVV